jgi:hypothetical protein
MYPTTATFLNKLNIHSTTISFHTPPHDSASTTFLRDDLHCVVRPTAQNVCAARIIVIRRGGRIPYKLYNSFSLLLSLTFVLLPRLTWQMLLLGENIEQLSLKSRIYVN